MKKISSIIFIISFWSSFTFGQTQTAAVVSVYTQGVKISPEMAESLLRIELTKSEKFNVFDKLDMLEILTEQQIDVSNCFGKNCLLNIGKIADVDKMITGSIENLGKKIVMTVKILDVRSGKYDKIAVEEFINLDTELQIMMQITLNKGLGIENDPDMLNNFVYYNLPPEAPITYAKNNGPRMGVALVTGDMSTILQADLADGGWDLPFPVLTQLGYQLEGAYLSAGNFQALIEGMVLLTGVEQGMFNPSFTFINGFRNSKNGWEFGFGPTFRFSKSAWGYYDNISAAGVHSQGSNNDIWNPLTNNNGSVLQNEPSFLTETITHANGDEVTYNVERRMDSRGPVAFSPAFVFAIGKTFKSGYLNIPVNLFLSSSKSGQFVGLSMGFNIAKKE
ncbi:MAG: CsgG/HfaB family protein [Flavobacteriales bacterium]|nr:CsgG/HfaB family protein [Flavobacteriales bacterium]